MSDIGKGYGCGVTVVIAVLPLFPLAFALGWSGAHCDPVPSCQRSAEWHIGLIFGGIILLAAAVGYAVRQLLNIVAAQRDDEGHSITFSGIAITLSALASLLALALLYRLASF
jgi:hypothetical protein